MTTGKRSNYYQRGIGYLLFTAGMILSVYIGGAVWRGYNTHDWQQANGIVYRSDMIQTTQLGEEALYQADVSYRYQYRGENFSGANLYRTDLPFNPETSLASQLASFPVGSVQLIYINPANPAESVLVQGVQTQLIVGLIFALTCFALGMASFRGR